MKVFETDKQIKQYIEFRSGALIPICLITMTSVAAVCFWLLWDSSTMKPVESHIEYLKLVLAGKKSLADYWHVLDEYKLAAPIVFNGTVSIIAGMLMAIVLARPWFTRPDKIQGFHVIDGYQVIEDAKEGVRVLRKKAEIWKKKGIRIYNGVGGTFNMPYALESKGLIFCGAVGTGKTAAMLHSIESIIERGDKVIIYDYKGDMTEWIAGKEGAFLLGFADSRSEKFPWHIAKDINSPLLAREFAKTIVQETSEPVWGNNARDVLSGCIEYLIATKPNLWGFKDVSELLNGDRKNMVSCLRSINHGAANTIDKPNDDKGASSIMSTLRSGAWIIDVLAKAWGNPSEGFSIHAWLRDDDTKQKIIILRNYPELSAVSNWLLYIIFNQMFGEVLALTDSSERRVWAIIDELATLPAMPRLEECLVAARSKGCRFMVGIQNFSSLREKYGSNVAQTILSQFSTRVICRVMDSESAKSLAKDMGGERQVKRAEIKHIQTLDEFGERKMKWDVTWRETTEPTMLDSQIMSLPDPTEGKCVVAWLYMAGFSISKLKWNFLNIKATADRDIPAAWIGEAVTIQQEKQVINISAKQEKSKVNPFPKGGRLSQEMKENTDFEDLENISDFPKLDGDN
ncbi:MAG: type IV secretion system DNA-binding domain-containing protein [Mariprofundaceae bacterium]